MAFSNKKLFKNEQGEVHVGLSAPEDFRECELEYIKQALVNLDNRIIWRCIVCNDLSIAQSPPRICPTCFQEEVYVQINKKEFKNLLEI